MPYAAIDPNKMAEPKSGVFDVKVNEWWLVDDQERLIFYRRTEKSSSTSNPMCNPDKRVSDVIVKQYPDYKVKQIALVFIPHTCEY
ncbi:hypothetical protein SEA_HUWBERT_21 [Microbacterium phage Huwbert]|nr:hypothetical protein SEA_HUWBERT_21 [Microbacterium phage Huwbert]